MATINMDQGNEKPHNSRWMPQCGHMALVVLSHEKHQPDNSNTLTRPICDGKWNFLVQLLEGQAHWFDNVVFAFMQNSNV